MNPYNNNPYVTHLISRITEAMDTIIMAIMEVKEVNPTTILIIILIMNHIKNLISLVPDTIIMAKEVMQVIILDTELMQEIVVRALQVYVVHVVCCKVV